MDREELRRTLNAITSQDYCTRTKAWNDAHDEFDRLQEQVVDALHERDELVAENERIRIAHNEEIDRNMELQSWLDQIVQGWRETTAYTPYPLSTAIHNYVESKQEKPQLNYLIDCCECGTPMHSTDPFKETLCNVCKPQLQLCPECKGAMKKPTQIWEWATVPTDEDNFLIQLQRVVGYEMNDCPICKGQGIIEKGEKC